MGIASVHMGIHQQNQNLPTTCRTKLLVCRINGNHFSYASHWRRAAFFTFQNRMLASFTRQTLPREDPSLTVSNPKGAEEGPNGKESQTYHPVFK
ncbi:hypothetical protein KU43_05740 [Mesotoga sp. SC_NapDC2]|nr:hypothetical protein RM69_02870 [Mesotoga sp. SC_NapDC3]PXF33850.1 hypothetical protein EU77_11140 [Mesotoga sp. SC_NapDC]RIZ60938.1 hypothetical protein KU43_05740 [Mesotoga sp. SC_NapDC2]